MSRRTRIILAVIGLALVFISLLALGYAFQSGEINRAGATLAPTLLTLPPGGAP
jgi:hypothetical protein